jgi:hypothetical protein
MADDNRVYLIQHLLEDVSTPTTRPPGRVERLGLGRRRHRSSRQPTRTTCTGTTRSRSTSTTRTSRSEDRRRLGRWRVHRLGYAVNERSLLAKTEIDYEDVRDEAKVAIAQVEHLTDIPF